MIFKSFLNVLFALNVLNVINANENDVRFDFTKYFKVNLATNKPTVLPVTLYNPYVWPGPNDTHSTSTTTPLPTTPKRRFVFGLRRSVSDRSSPETHKFRNRGYGYDNNISQHITSPPIVTTISPFNRKFYTLDFNHVLNNSNTNFYTQDIQIPGIQEFRGFRNLSRNFQTPKDTERYPGNRNLSRYPNTTRRVIKRRRFPVYRNTTKKPTRWQIFPTNTPRFNFSRDLGDFQEIVKNDFSKWTNYSGNFNQLTVNRTADVSFNCNKMRYFGYYADIESNCKIFHVCTPDGLKVSFACPDKLRFNQEMTVCDWSRNVRCRQSPNFYDINIIKFGHWNLPSMKKR